MRYAAQTRTLLLGKIRAIGVCNVGVKDLDELVGRNVEIVTHDGKIREGKVDAVDRYNVSLLFVLEAGEMAMMVRRREVREVRVKD